MFRVRKQLKAVGVIVSALLITVSSLAGSIVYAEPAYWDWQKASPDSWANTDNHTGPMIWGGIDQMAVFNGAMWAVGRDASGHGIVYRYDMTTGAWTDNTPYGLDAGANGEIMSISVINNKLWIGTRNDDAAELWSSSTGNANSWTKDTGLLAMSGFNLFEIHSIFEASGWLCLTGRGTSSYLQFYCNNGSEWFNMDIGVNGGAFYASNWRSFGVFAGSNFYINAADEGEDDGIWTNSGESFVPMSAPFIDSETNWQVRAMVPDGGNLNVVVANGSGDAQAWRYNGSTWTQLGTDNFGLGADRIDYASATLYQGSLVLGVGTYGTSSQIIKYNGSTWTRQNPDYYGQPENEDGYNPMATSAMLADDDTLFVATWAVGEGSYFPQIYRTPALVVNDDDEDDEIGDPGDINTDDDMISDAIEGAAPNNGDGNNDGEADSEQANVTSLVNSVTGKYAVLESSVCAENSNVSVTPESANTKSDSGYSYPAGMMNFTLNCPSNGATATVTHIYYGNYEDASRYEMRKYDENTKTYTTVLGATITKVTIAGQPALKVTYQITDGGPLDQDGVANSTIVDPAGPALKAASGSLPDTGLNLIITSLIATSIVAAAVILMRLRPKNTTQRS